MNNCVWCATYDNARAKGYNDMAAVALANAAEEETAR